MEALTLIFQMRDMFSSKLAAIQKRVQSMKSYLDTMNKSAMNFFSNISSFGLKIGALAVSFMGMQSAFSKMDEQYMKLGGTFSNTFEYKFIKIQDAFEKQFAGIKQQLDVLFMPILDKIYQFVNDGTLVSLFKRIGDTIQYMIDKASGFHSVMKAIVAGFTAFKILSVLPIPGLSQSMGLIYGIGVAVGALIYVLDSLVQKYNEMNGTSISTFGIITGYFNMLWGYIKIHITFIMNMFTILSDFISNVFKDPLGAMKQLWFDVIEEITTYFKKNIEYIVDAIHIVGKGIRNVVDVLLGRSPKQDLEEQNEEKGKLQKSEKYSYDTNSAEDFYQEGYKIGAQNEPMPTTEKPTTESTPAPKQKPHTNAESPSSKTNTNADTKKEKSNREKEKEKKREEKTAEYNRRAEERANKPRRSLDQPGSGGLRRSKVNSLSGLDTFGSSLSGGAVSGLLSDIFGAVIEPVQKVFHKVSDFFRDTFSTPTTGSESKMKKDFLSSEDQKLVSELTSSVSNSSPETTMNIGSVQVHLELQTKQIDSSSRQNQDTWINDFCNRLANALRTIPEKEHLR